tara:strand:+ start:909 stop:1190 length:282 start_codon:yes stop_codon:yes gene_type:complete
VAKHQLKKINIINNLNKRSGFSSNFAKKLINDLIKIIIKNIKSGNFNLKNVGSFKVIKKEQRIGRNPKTKEEFIISSRNSLSFISSINIKKLI